MSGRYSTKMARKKEANAEDLEMEQMSRSELARLRRQYRIMEGDREAYSEEMKMLLQKQRKTLDILQREKADLFYELNCTKCPLNESKTEINSKKLRALLRIHEKLHKEVVREKSQAKEFDLQINKLEKEFQETKVKSGGKNTSREEAEALERIQRQLENRLDVATVKLNRLLTGNQQLRQEIDHFLKERSLFKRAREDLAGRLEAGKKAIMDLMDQSTLAYDQREEAQGKLEALKQKGKQDLVVHGQEIKELQRKLDHDSKLQQFLGVKGQKRIMADLEAKEALRKQQQKEALELKIQHYQSLLQRIREISEETDVDRLAAQFLKQEEENFALFNYVNELNNELEAIQEQLDEINKNVEEQRALCEEKALKKQAATETLLVELTETKKRRLETQENFEKWQKTDDDLLKGLRLLFEILKSEDNPVLHLLGENVAVTSFNFSLYLQVIEKRAAQLGLLYNYWQKTTGLKDTKIVNQK